MRALLFAVLVLGGCGGGDGTGGDGGGADSAAGLDGGSGCTSATQCPSGQVCNPATRECTTTLPCSGHADCGGGAFCSSGTCTINTTGGPCVSDTNCLTGERCIGGQCGCNGETYGAESVPPNMLIVLDRSNSMNDSIGAQTKWEIALDAIDGMLATYGDRVRFGLMLYPGLNESCSMGMDCGPGHAFVDPGEGTAAMINTVLGNASTCMFGTPTAEALDVLVDYAGLTDTTRPNHVLLITDGQSTCDDPVASVTSLRGETPEIRTFVIGFGSGADPTELTAMANAGGTARTGPQAYYQADDAAGLAGAFSTIAGSVLSCTYVLSDVPTDLGQLYVYFDQRAIARDTSHSGGWDYEAAANQVTFYGTECDMLRSASVANLVIVYGCPIF